MGLFWPQELAPILGRGEARADPAGEGAMGWPTANHPSPRQIDSPREGPLHQEPRHRGPTPADRWTPAMWAEPSRDASLLEAPQLPRDDLEVLGETPGEDEEVRDPPEEGIEDGWAPHQSVPQDGDTLEP
jgi:hypothetical protein